MIVPFLLASGVAYAAPTLDYDGVCPSIAITLTGATPRRQVTLYSGDTGATTTLLAGPCAGTTIDLADANQRKHQLVTTRTDSAGGLTFTPAGMTPSDCASGALQGLDLTTCEVTEVVSLKIDCGTLDDGLIAHWSGNDTTADFVGGHHGTAEGTVNYVAGVSGDAFEFDGRSAVKIGATDDLEFADGEPFTWGMSIYEESTSSQHLFGKRHGCSSGGSFDYQMYVEPRGGSHWGPDACSMVFFDFPAIDTWQYLLAMYTGTEFDLYVDGELVSSSGECVGDAMGGHGAEFRIGRSGTCSGWVGLVDEVKLWDRALDVDEVLCASRAGH